MAEVQPPEIEVDNEHGRLGWTRPLEIGAHTLELHKGGSLAATIAATGLASALFTGIHISPEGLDMTGHHTTTHVAVDQSYDVATRTDHHYVSKNQTVTIPTTATSQVAFTAVMPDVTNFDLSRSPNSHYIKNQPEVGGYLNQVTRLVQQGWSVAEISVNGMASDETRLDTQAGIGEPDAGNQRLASQYGQFVEQAVAQELAAAHITVPSSQYALTSAEVSADQNVITSLAKTEAKTSTLQLIQAYKTNTQAASAQRPVLHCSSSLTISAALMSSYP